MEIDLKDRFLGISVDKKLSELFEFTHGDRRYQWNSLPQGWKWSMILLHEAVAEIVQGIPCLQYADNVLIGAESVEESQSISHQVFVHFDEYGIKVNYDKVQWGSETIQFLWCQMSNGHWSHENFLKKKLAELGEVCTIKDLERIIGVISYAFRCVKDVEVILGSLREALRTFKAGGVSEEWLGALNDQIKEALEKAIANVHWLILPGTESYRFTFVIESDWSSKHADYMLFAARDGEERLLDMGSRMQKLVSTSYLGELNALVWA